MKKPAFVKTFLLSFMILTLSLLSFSKEKTIASNWTSTPINIDGSNVDWVNDALNFEKKVSVDYAFKNDAENLYVLFIFKDPKYLSSIRATGMTVWFNLEGKKKKNYGITFLKKQVSADAFISILEQKKGPLSEEEKNNVRANPYYFLHSTKVINKKSKSSSHSPASGEIKPAVFRSIRQKNAIVYEFAIPLTRKTEQAPGIGTEPGKIIKVGFEWGGMTKEMRIAMMERSAAAGARPENPKRSGGSWAKERSYSTGAQGTGSGPKKYSLWVDIQLTLNQ